MTEIPWNLPAPPGFQGLDPDKLITKYTRHLPHWRQDGASYFVTFRQNDSLPQSKLRELHAFRLEWQRKNPPPQTDEQWDALTRETTKRIEGWLDQGFGSCGLRVAQAQYEIVSSLHFFDQDRYELGCYVVMPNHVHVIVRPLLPARYPLENILHSWKRYSAVGINRHFGLSGAFWQDESFDRILRDEEHLWRCIQYIGRNPALAGLDPSDFVLWIRPEWVQLGWRFDAT